ncbi:hypothetical protein BSIN_0154 [Burkholderia singularis]|uniref:Uncharacterized protein n=1 Tax=Burkholderia singularis TaxID=1503053 RepID=A0A238H2E2_9BURK|nr:hypothetical protein BSIN_0154 [Burkholderia singularis]
MQQNPRRRPLRDSAMRHRDDAGTLAVPAERERECAGTGCAASKLGQ